MTRGEAEVGRGEVLDLRKGDLIAVRSHASELGKGLSYPAFTGFLLDDAGCSEGWDVVDVETDAGEVSIYCFSIERESNQEG